jgi:hypothetical protein
MLRSIQYLDGNQLTVPAVIDDYSFPYLIALSHRFVPENKVEGISFPVINDFPPLPPVQYLLILLAL